MTEPTTTHHMLVIENEHGVRDVMVSTNPRALPPAGWHTVGPMISADLYAPRSVDPGQGSTDE